MITRRNIIDGFIFLAGLILVDLIFGYYIDSLAKSTFWSNTTLTKLASTKNIDILLIGNCRTADQIDSNILKNRLNATVFNAGKIEESLGYMDLSLNIALSHNSPKIVLIQIDSLSLSQDNISIRKEMISNINWFSLVSTKRRSYLVNRYGLEISQLLNLSGLWRYRGKGEIIFSSITRFINNQADVTADGFKPLPSSKNILSALAPGTKTSYLIQNSVSNTFIYSIYAVDTISSMIDNVKSAGIFPILLVPPMHYYDSNNDVISKEKQVMYELAHKHNVPLLFYHDNSSSISRNGVLWSDTTHLNRQGAEVFSEILATDIQKIIKEHGATHHIVCTQQFMDDEETNLGNLCISHPQH